MKQYKGAASERMDTRTLPAGGYVARILHAEVESFDWGEKLRIDFDICEGEYKGYFDQQFAASNFDDKKWKGAIRLVVPNEGSQYFEGEKRRFNNFIWSIENSNKGYTWGWDESTLTGKMIGVIFGNKEWEYKGKTGWAAVCTGLCSVDDIRMGNYKVPADKPLKKPAEPAVSGAEAFASVSEDELPF